MEFDTHRNLSKRRYACLGFRVSDIKICNGYNLSAGFEFCSTTRCAALHQPSKIIFNTTIAQVVRFSSGLNETISGCDI